MNMFLSENEKARPKIILFCEMRAVIKRPKPYHLFYEGMNFKASFTRKNFEAAIGKPNGQYLKGRETHLPSLSVSRSSTPQLIFRATCHP
ncbi:hypothetical protein ABD74_00400 [Brevibacillus laterosporus]|nr:hypothetical protein [Brevibacillus laterosporus]QMV49158.1 hypothetical protein Goe13_c00570 [Bacillus phage vB_BsuS-Goe13]